MSANHNIIDLYHGSDHIVELPAFGVGKPDNDYGSGFYTTRILNRASEWALLFGMKEAKQGFGMGTIIWNERSQS